MTTLETTLLWVTIAIAIVVLFLLGAGVYFYNFAILRQKKLFMQETPDLVLSGKPWQTREEWLGEQSCEKLTLQSHDGLTLYGHFVRAAKPTKHTAILVHGYTGKGRDMSGFAQYYAEKLKFNVLMPDLRGHGESTGDYIGFGWNDRKDVLLWIDEMIKRVGPDVEIVLHGISMGGGTVLMTSGESLPSQVKCIVSDCAYSSVKGILSYQLKRMFKLPPFPLLNVTSLVCKLRANYFFGEASALAQVQKTTKPILFIHGGKDTFVPTTMVHELYAAKPGDKELFIVPEAGHGNAYWTDIKGYSQHVENFISKYIPTGHFRDNPLA